MFYQRVLFVTGIIRVRRFFMERVFSVSCSALFVPSIVFPIKVLFLTGVIRGPRFYIDKVFLCELPGSICVVSCSSIRKFYFLQVLFVDHGST